MHRFSRFLAEILELLLELNSPLILKRRSDGTLVLGMQKRSNASLGSAVPNSLDSSCMKELVCKEITYNNSLLYLYLPESQRIRKDKIRLVLSSGSLSDGMTIVFGLSFIGLQIFFKGIRRCIGV